MRVRGLCLGVVLFACTPSLAQNVLTLERVLWQTGARTFFPTFEDYTGDGVHELIGQRSTCMQVLDGVDGSVVWQYDPPSSGAGFTSRAVTIPDADGDGKREIVIGGNHDVWALKSSAGGGPVDGLGVLFSLHGLPYGTFMATNDHVVAIASDDHSRLQTVDAASGQTWAHVSHLVSYGYEAGSLGQSAVNVGDLNGDGFDDFASSGGNVKHPGDPTGSVFLFDGALTTSGVVALPDLPAGAVLGELTGVEFLGSGSATHARNTTVNLGDPYPGNGQTEFLLVCGSPWGNYERGGITAHVMTRHSDGSLTTTRVAAYNHTGGKHQYGRELIDLGDVTGDGVHDLAIVLGSYPSDFGLKGRIVIVDGAGLLDGYDPAADVIEVLDGHDDAFFYKSVHGLGDYDGDGLLEIGVSVVYNGRDGVYGGCQHIYEVIPEPATLALLGLGAIGLIRRRRRVGPAPSRRNGACFRGGFLLLTIALGVGAAQGQWSLQQIGSRFDALGRVNVVFDSRNVAYVGGMAREVYRGGPDHWEVIPIGPAGGWPCAAILGAGAGQVAALYGNGRDLCYRRLDGEPGEPETVFTFYNDAGGMTGGVFFDAKGGVYAAFSDPSEWRAYFASRGPGGWSTESIYVRRLDGDECAATHGGTPESPYFFGAQELSGKVMLLRPGMAEAVEILDPPAFGLCSAATSPGGQPALMHMGWDRGVDELYLYTPSGDQWAPTPMGLFPVWDRYTLRRLCDFEFLSDGSLAVAYWNGDEDSVHCAVGRPGEWSETVLPIPYGGRAENLGIGVSDDDRISIAVSIEDGRLYYMHYVPEPAALSLLALGGLAILRRRRKQTARKLTGLGPLEGRAESVRSSRAREEAACVRSGNQGRITCGQPRGGGTQASCGGSDVSRWAERRKQGTARAGRLTKLLVLTILAALSHVVEAVPPGYVVVDLGALAGDPGETRVEGINNLGQAVGTSRGTGYRRAFLWEGGTMQDLGVLGGRTSRAYAVNDNAVVIGDSTYGPSTDLHAFRWESGVMTDLETLGGSRSYARDINQAGQVVGYSQLGLGYTHACLWENGQIVDLGTLGGQQSWAMAINDLGQVVGYSYTAEGAMRATRWEGGNAFDLGTPVPPHLGSQSLARDINNLGQVVGYSMASGYIYADAFLWDGGAFTVLPFPEGNESMANAINDAGQIVGWYASHDLWSRAILWEDEVAYNLNDFIPGPSEWTLESAQDINNRGAIVAYGTNRDGLAHSFLLIPIPEPGTLSLLSLGGLAFIRRRRL